MSIRRDTNMARPAEDDIRITERGWTWTPTRARSPRPWAHHAYALPVVRELPRPHPDDGVGATW